MNMKRTALVAWRFLLRMAYLRGTMMIFR